jgi:hypothetical protein
VLREHLERLQAITSQVANSVSIAPPPPTPLERPVVEINGERYQFKSGQVRLSAREVVKSTNLADDQARLEEVFGKYPGLFIRL